MILRSWSTRLSALALGAVVLVGVDRVGSARERTPRPTSAPCVHELILEPFAGLILVPLQVAGSPPLDFVLDSGANRSSLSDPLLAAALGLEVSQGGVARGMGPGAVGVLITEPVPLQSQGFELLRVPLAVHDFGARLAARAGRELDGFLGWELFDRYVVEVDAGGRRLLLHDPSSFVYRGPGQVLPLEVKDGRAVVRARVNVIGRKAVAASLLVDTGSGRYLTLITGARRRLEPPTEKGHATSVGIAGATSVEVGRVAEVELGEVVVENVETAWVRSLEIPATTAIPKLDGVLGNRLLARYRVFFDYRHGQLILEPPSGRPNMAAEKSDTWSLYPTKFPCRYGRIVACLLHSPGDVISILVRGYQGGHAERRVECVGGLAGISALG